MAVGDLIVRVTDPTAAIPLPPAPPLDTRASASAALRLGLALGTQAGHQRGHADARALSRTWLSHHLAENRTMVYRAADHRRLGQTNKPWHRNPDMAMNRQASDEPAELVTVHDPSTGGEIARLRTARHASSRSVYDTAYRLGVRTGYRAAWLQGSARAVLDAAMVGTALVGEGVTPAELRAARTTSHTAAPAVVAPTLPPVQALLRTRSTPAPRAAQAAQPDTSWPAKRQSRDHGRGIDRQHGLGP